MLQAPPVSPWIQGIAAFAGEENGDAGVGLPVDGVLEDDGNFVSREGTYLPTRHPGRQFGLPAAACDDRISGLLQRLTRLGDEFEGEVRLDPANRLQAQFDVGGKEGAHLLEQLGALLGAVVLEVLEFEVGG
ncbi:MAG: hypothetical protein RLZ70_1562 [Verrucomicrobiota bacterium]